MKKVYEQPDLQILSFSLKYAVLGGPIVSSIENDPQPGGGSVDEPEDDLLL